MGFVVSLVALNHFVAMLVGTCARFGFLLYLYLSLVLIFSCDTPYHIPLTMLIWVISMGITILFLCFCYFIASQCLDPEETHCIQELFWTYYQQMTKEVEKLANKVSSHLTSFTLLWTFNSIDGDCDMEQFLSAIPGFYASATVWQDECTFEEFNSGQLPSSIVLFMDHTLSSDLLTESQRQNCVMICLRAINVTLPLNICLT